MSNGRWRASSRKRRCWRSTGTTGTTDPFARGTWLGPVVGADAAYDAATWTREGRLAFATSDFAREDAGWFEAAIISGEDAAAEIIAAL